MKKILNSLLVLLSLFFVNAFADPLNTNPILIHWDASHSSPKSDPIFIYKAIQNPIDADRSHCKLTKDGIVRGDEGTQCYVWKQVGYLTRGNAKNNYAFVDAPSTTDAYGHSEMYKLAQGSVDAHHNVLRWVGLCQFDVSALTATGIKNAQCGLANSNNYNSRLFSSFQKASDGGNYNVVTLSSMPTHNGLIGFDFSVTLPAYYQTATLHTSTNVDVWNGQSNPVSAGIYADEIKNVTLDSHTYTNFDTLYDKAWNAKTQYYFTIRSESTYAFTVGSKEHNHFAFGPPNSAITTRFNTVRAFDASLGTLFPTQDSYCVNLTTNQVALHTVMDPFTANQTFLCARQIGLNYEYGSDAAPGVGNLFIFNSLGKTWVAANVNPAFPHGASTRLSVNDQMGDVDDVKNSASDKTLVIERVQPRFLKYEPNQVNVIEMRPGFLNTDTNKQHYFLKSEFKVAPLVFYSDLANTLSFDQDNKLHGKMFLTTVDGFDASNLSFRLYTDGPKSQGCAQGHKSPCNPGWVMNNILLPFHYANGVLDFVMNQSLPSRTVSMVPVAPSSKFHVFLFLSHSHSPFEGSESNGAWSMPTVCHNHLLTDDEYCNINVLPNGVNPHHYALSGMGGLQTSNDYQNDQIHLTFQTPSLSPAELALHPERALLPQDIHYALSSSNINDPKPLPVSHFSCDSASCETIINGVAPGAYYFTIVAALSDPTASDWINTSTNVMTQQPVNYFGLSPMSLFLRSNTVSQTSGVVYWTGGDLVPAVKDPTINTKTSVAVCPTKAAKKENNGYACSEKWIEGNISGKEAQFTGLDANANYVAQLSVQAQTPAHEIDAKQSIAFTTLPFALKPLMLTHLLPAFGEENTVTVAWTGGSIDPLNDTPVAIKATACLQGEMLNDQCENLMAPTATMMVNDKTAADKKSLTLKNLKPNEQYTLLLSANVSKPVANQRISAAVVKQDFTAAGYTLSNPTLNPQDVTSTYDAITVKDWKAGVIDHHYHDATVEPVYILYLCANGEARGQCQRHQILNEEGDAFTFDGLNQNTQYSVYLDEKVALPAQLLKASSAVVAVKTPIHHQAAEHLSVVRGDDLQQAVVSWDALGSDSLINSVVLTVTDEQGAVTTYPLEKTATHFVVNNLLVNKPYVFAMVVTYVDMQVAKTSVNYSSQVDYVGPTALEGHVGANPSQGVFTWTGASPVSLLESYTLTLDGEGIHRTVDVKDTSATVNDLKPNGKYTVSVTANFRNNDSKTESIAYQQDVHYTAPSNLRVVRGNSVFEATFSWDKATPAELLSPDHAYTVRMTGPNNQTAIVGANQTSFTTHLLQGNYTYKFEVTATFKDGTQRVSSVDYYNRSNG